MTNCKLHSFEWSWVPSNNIKAVHLARQKKKPSGTWMPKTQKHKHSEHSKDLINVKYYTEHTNLDIKMGSRQRPLGSQGFFGGLSVV